MDPLLFLKPKNQKKTLAFVVVFVSICLLAQFLSPIYQAKASGATYYVSNCGVVGNDSNNGTSPSTPWLTIAKVNSSTFNPGDSILFYRGCIWHEELTVSSSGSVRNPITFGAYGSGAMPEISGADVETGWTSASASTGLTGDSNLRAYWMMNNNFNDGTTYANNLTNSNGVAFSSTAYQASSSASFQSSSSQSLSRADASLSANFPGKSSTSTEDFTLGAWVQFASTSTNMSIFQKGYSGSYTLAYQSSNHTFYTQTYDGGAYTTAISNVAYTNTNTWHFIVTRYKGSTNKEISLFIDGVKQSTPQIANNAVISADSAPFTIGADSFGGGYWNGLIDEPFVFNRALADSEIESIYTNGLAGSSFTVYYKTLASQPSIILENGHPYSSVASESALTPGTFWWNSVSSSVYIRTTGDNNPSGYTMEASTRNLAVNPNGQDYFTLQNLYIYGAGAQTLFEGTSNHVILNDDRLGDSYFEGALFGSSSTRAMLGLGANQQLNYAYPMGATVQAALISTLGGKVSLSDVDWSQVEPTEGVFNWSGPDAAAAACQSTRMQCIFSIYGSPSWANGTSSSEFYVPTGPAFTAWVTAYTSFAQAAASRYHTSVKMWELWNEPNSYVFWQSPTNPSVSEYVTWGESVYSAMKAIDPTLQIVTQETAPNIGDGVTVIPGVTWLADLYADGFYADGNSIHPYSGSDDNSTESSPYSTISGQANFSDIALIRNVMVTAGRSNDPLWATEFGWSSGLLGASTQAQDVMQSLEMLKDLYPYVSVGAYFDDIDNPGQPAPFNTMGLYDDNPTEKLAARAFNEFNELWVDPAVLSVPTSTINFSVTQGSAATSSQNIVVTNTGGAFTTLNWSATSTQPWLTFSPASGSLAGGVSSSISLVANQSGLGVGTYNATATISDPNASGSPETFAVTFSINEPPPPPGVPQSTFTFLALGESSTASTTTSTTTPAATSTPNSTSAPSTASTTPTAISIPTSSLQTQLNTLLAELASLEAQAGVGSTSSQTSAFIFSRNLQLYDTGSDVKALQSYLIEQDKGLAAAKLKAHGVTNTFGMLTFNSLVEFQKAVGITPASGYFGRITRNFVNGHE